MQKVMVPARPVSTRIGRKWESGVQIGPNIYYFVRRTKTNAEKAAVTWAINGGNRT